MSYVHPICLTIITVINVMIDNLIYRCMRFVQNLHFLIWLMKWINMFNKRRNTLWKINSWNTYLKCKGFLRINRKYRIPNCFKILRSGEWLKSKDHILFWQMTGVRFPINFLSNSQPHLYSTPVLKKINSFSLYKTLNSKTKQTNKITQ